MGRGASATLPVWLSVSAGQRARFGVTAFVRPATGPTLIRRTITGSDPLRTIMPNAGGPCKGLHILDL